MNKLLSRIILWFTALSAVFFTSSVFANTALDWSVYTISAGRVLDASGSAFLGWYNKSSTLHASDSLCTIPYYNSYYTQKVIAASCGTSSYRTICYSWSTVVGQTNLGTYVAGSFTADFYGNYARVGVDYVRASDCAIITQAQALALPAYVPPWTCNSDTIATWWNCSCKNSGTYSASWSAVSMDWKYDWMVLSGSQISQSYDTQVFASSKTNINYMKYNLGSFWKPDPVLGQIDESNLWGATVGRLQFLSQTGTLSNNTQIIGSSTANYFTVETFAYDESLNPYSSEFSSWSDNVFNSFTVNQSTGTTSFFKVYYLKWRGFKYSSLDDAYDYLGMFQSNTYVTLPYGVYTQKIKLVPTSSAGARIAWVSLWMVPFKQDQVCSFLDGSALTAELASRSTLSGSIIANTNFCWSALDVPYIGSALGAMCNFVQPLIKPLVSGYQTTVDMINIIPPSTAPTTFDYYPSFTFSWMTMHISTQTGAIPVYSSWSDVNPLKITSDESSSNMKIWILALISIILYLVVYALHFWIVAGLVWLLLHISRFFTGFLWKHSGTGNIWSLAPFLVYAWVFFTALLSIIASVSFLLPLLQVIRAYALFLITWLTSFAPWSYALFSGFYIVVFSSIFLVGTFYLIHVLFEKHSRLN